MAVKQHLTDAEFELFRDLIYQSCGIVFNERNRLRLNHKVGTRMEEQGMSSVSDYLGYLNKRSPGQDREIKILLDTLTVNETFFFRNINQFDALRDHVIPELRKKKEGIPGVRPRLRIWSAGCSTGQETYSLAMVAADSLGIQLSHYDVNVTGVDISETSLEVARVGIYPDKRMEQVDARTRSRWFDKQQDNVQVKEAIRKLVKFQYGNLKKDSPSPGQDVIFCRNVMIYFDEVMQKEIINRFHAALQPGGYLFIGHSESLQTLSNRFKFVMLGKGIAYQRLD